MGSKKRKSKQKKLETTVLGVQQRWGPTALRRMEPPSTQAEVPHIPTGLPSLDAALGIGGIPQGRITEILGPPTSGKTTLTNIIMANAQRTGSLAAYVDLSQTFDAHYAVKCGVDLRDLVIAQPHNGSEALEMTVSLVTSGGVSVLVFDSVSAITAESQPPPFLSAVLRRLAGCVARSPCALIFLTSLLFEGPSSAANYPNEFALSYYASIRLLVERERWLQRRGNIQGYSARATVIKNKLAAPGKRSLIRFTFNGRVKVTNGGSG